MISLEIQKKLNEKNPNWFSSENIKFFGDLEYWFYINTDGKTYLIRKTNAWTDMFDGVKKVHYRINKIDNFKISDLFDEHFKTLEEAKTFLD